jgi:hypothetical protein
LLKASMRRLMLETDLTSWMILGGWMIHGGSLFSSAWDSFKEESVNSLYPFGRSWKRTCWSAPKRIS